MGQGHPPTPKHDEPAEEGEEDEGEMQQDEQIRLQAVGHGCETTVMKVGGQILKEGQKRLSAGQRRGRVFRLAEAQHRIEHKGQQNQSEH